MSYVNFDKQTKVWTSCDAYSAPIHNPKLSLSHVVLRSLEQHGSKIAQVIKSKTQRNERKRK